MITVTSRAICLRCRFRVCNNTHCSHHPFIHLSQTWAFVIFISLLLCNHPTGVSERLARGPCLEASVPKQTCSGRINENQDVCIPADISCVHYAYLLQKVVVNIWLCIVDKEKNQGKTVCQTIVTPWLAYTNDFSLVSLDQLWWDLCWLLLFSQHTTTDAWMLLLIWWNRGSRWMTTSWYRGPELLVSLPYKCRPGWFIWDHLHFESKVWLKRAKTPCKRVRS